jgi:hypothetical protein
LLLLLLLLLLLVVALEGLEPLSVWERGVSCSAIGEGWYMGWAAAAPFVVVAWAAGVASSVVRAFSCEEESPSLPFWRTGAQFWLVCAAILSEVLGTVSSYLLESGGESTYFL